MAKSMSDKMGSSDISILELGDRAPVVVKFNAVPDPITQELIWSKTYEVTISIRSPADNAKLIAVFVVEVATNFMYNEILPYVCVFPFGSYWHNENQDQWIGAAEHEDLARKLSPKIYKIMMMSRLRYRNEIAPRRYCWQPRYWMLDLILWKACILAGSF